MDTGCFEPDDTGGVKEDNMRCTNSTRSGVGKSTPAFSADATADIGF
jgi:hypothetical protein